MFVRITGHPQGHHLYPTTTGALPEATEDFNGVRIYGRVFFGGLEPGCFFVGGEVHPMRINTLIGSETKGTSQWLELSSLFGMLPRIGPH